MIVAIRFMREVSAEHSGPLKITRSGFHLRYARRCCDAPRYDEVAVGRGRLAAGRLGAMKVLPRHMGLGPAKPPSRQIDRFCDVGVTTPTRDPMRLGTAALQAPSGPGREWRATSETHPFSRFGRVSTAQQVIELPGGRNPVPMSRRDGPPQLQKGRVISSIS
jgi:hypothetical protein